MASARPIRGPDPASALSRDDIACFIYTSGTGGNPKGVILSQGNLLANVAGAHTVLEKLGLDKEVFLSFLPLSHAYEHTVGQFLPIAVGAQIYYAEGTETLTANLLEVRPTIMTCVPRLYEVMRQRILNSLSRRGGLGPQTVRQGGRAGVQEGRAAGLARPARAPVRSRPRPAGAREGQEPLRRPDQGAGLGRRAA